MGLKIAEQKINIILHLNGNYFTLIFVESTKKNFKKKFVFPDYFFMNLLQ